MQQSCSTSMQAPCYGKYYVYTSHPALAHSDRPRKPKPSAKKSGACFANHATNIRTRGAHEFYNMMWDPSVYRGNTTQPYSNAEYNRCRKHKEFQENVKRRKFPRKQKLVGGIERQLLSAADEEEKIGLEDMGMQTEQFLQELTSDVAKKDMCTQVEPGSNSRKEAKVLVLRPFMTGTSQSIQTDLNLTYQFEENVRPVQQELSRKILTQSLLETTEELELESLRREKRKYVQMRSEELYRIKRAVDAQRVVAEERAEALMMRQNEERMEDDAVDRLGAALFSAGHMGGILPVTFGVLKLEGYMPESGCAELYENLVPWIDEQVKNCYSERNMLSRKLLDEMIDQVTSTREVEIASSQWFAPGTVSTSQSQHFDLLPEDEPQATTKTSFSNPDVGTKASSSNPEVGKLNRSSKSESHSHDMMSYGYDEE